MERAATARSNTPADQFVARCAPDCACSGPSCGAASAPSFRRWIAVYFASASRSRSHCTRGRSSVSVVLHLQPEKFVALLQVRIFDGDLRQAIRMRIQQPHVGLPAARRGGSCGASIASSSGSSRFSDTTTTMRATGSAPCSFHAMRRGVRVTSSVRSCGHSAIRLDVLFEPDAGDRVGVRDNCRAGAAARSNPAPETSPARRFLRRCAALR